MFNHGFCLVKTEMDLYTTNPGPVDDSVLYDQEKHVSSAVWEGQVKFKNCSNIKLFSSYKSYCWSISF